MQRLHLLIGLVALLFFPATGLFMHWHEPALSALSPEFRLLFRSRHLYLMFAATTNLALGLYFQPKPSRARSPQQVGSALIAASPLLALAGFTKFGRSRAGLRRFRA